MVPNRVSIECPRCDEPIPLEVLQEDYRGHHDGQAVLDIRVDWADLHVHYLLEHPAEMDEIAELKPA